MSGRGGLQGREGRIAAGAGACFIGLALLATASAAGAATPVGAMPAPASGNAAQAATATTSTTATTPTTLWRCEADGKISCGDQPCATGKASTIAGLAAPTPIDQAEARRRAAADKRDLEILESRRFAEQQAALNRQMQLDIERNRLAAKQQQECQQRQVIAAKGPHTKIKSNNRIKGAHSILNPAQAGLPPCESIGKY